MHFNQPHRLRNVNVETIDDVEKYVKQEDFFCGFSTRNLLTKDFNDSIICESDNEKFIAAAFAFYRESLPYIFKKMYCDDESFSKHARWIDHFERKDDGQMLNILLNGSPTVSSLTITKLSVYTSNLLNLNASAMTSYQLTH